MAEVIATIAIARHRRDRFNPLRIDMVAPWIDEEER
jgi:hypothetical protein